ncbi:hypothetical protein E2P81_ATG11595 [Venturia nashicola]|nr:hypothetical protein E2P81_ATG11595 [Venturia nashicola]
MRLDKIGALFAAFLVLYIFGISDHSLIEGIDDVYEAERFDWGRLSPGESGIVDLIDAVPGLVYDDGDDDASEALVDIDISDALLSVQIKDARTAQQLAKDSRLNVAQHPRLPSPDPFAVLSIWRAFRAPLTLKRGVSGVHKTVAAILITHRIQGQGYLVYGGCRHVGKNAGEAASTARGVPIRLLACLSGTINLYVAATGE